MLFLFLFCSVRADDQVHPTCKDKELGLKCMQDCEFKAIECEVECVDPETGFVDLECSRDCLNELADCEYSCPCYRDCPDGCPCDEIGHSYCLCADLIECRKDVDEENCPVDYGCFWIRPNTEECHDPKFSGCYTFDDDEEDSGFCPKPVEKCEKTASTKKDCLAANCSWCSGECRDPKAELNEVCRDLVECPAGGTTKATCEAVNCVWRGKGDCNDPDFVGCYAPNDIEINNGVCPGPVEKCPTETTDKESCLAVKCSWCDGECRDPEATLTEECIDIIDCPAGNTTETEQD